MSTSQTNNNILLSTGSSTTMQFPNLSIKLDRTNYYSWRSVILSTLEAYDLDQYVLTKPKPKPKDDDAPSTEYTNWRKADRFVLVWLRSTLSEKLLCYVAKASTSYDAWTMISTMFQSQTRARLMTLKGQLQSLSKGSLSMMDYIEKKRSIVDALAECQYFVQDDDVVASLLHGLDSSYGPFKAAINVRVEPVSPDEIAGLLLHEEERLQQDSTPTVLVSTVVPPPAADAASPPVANTASSGSQSRSDSSSRGRGRGDRGRGRGRGRFSDNTTDSSSQQQ